MIYRIIFEIESEKPTELYTIANQAGDIMRHNHWELRSISLIPLSNEVE
jgi:hypothetical protein